MATFFKSSSVITGGTFTQVNHSAQTLSSQTPWDRLQAYVAPAAFHDSAERYDSPRCHPNTRVAVMNELRDLALRRGDAGNARILWLSGPAGAGKSAIAQSFCDECFFTNLLLASFFFNRSDPSRNGAKSFVATLTYQIYGKIPEHHQSLILSAIQHDPFVFERSIGTQFKALIMDPLRDLFGAGYFDNGAPALIVVDGLDECATGPVQVGILTALRNICKLPQSPFVIVIASRLEHDTQVFFRSSSLGTLFRRLNLDDSCHPDADIELFLREKIQETCETHPLKSSIPDGWPSREAIKDLVQKSSGQFIYASVVIKHITSNRHYPPNRLDVVRQLCPPRHDLSFAELDALYSHLPSDDSIDNVGNTNTNSGNTNIGSTGVASPSSAPAARFNNHNNIFPPKPGPDPPAGPKLIIRDPHPTPAASAAKPDISTAQWIWTNEQPYDEPPGGPRAFRKAVALPSGQSVDSMIIDVTCDNFYTLYINGFVVGNSTNWKIVQRYSIKFTRTNRVLIAVYASNDPNCLLPAGLIASANMWDSTNHNGHTYTANTDASWKTSISATASGFERLAYTPDSSWVNARVEGAYGMAPWGAVAKPTATTAVTGGFSGINGVADPPSAPAATDNIFPPAPGPDPIVTPKLIIPDPDPTPEPIPAEPDIGTANWIWTNERPYDEPPGGPRAFRKVVALPRERLADSMIIDITCDNFYTLYVNGYVVGNSTNWNIVQRYSIKFARTSRVLIAVYASNDPNCLMQAGLIASVVIWDSRDYSGRAFAFSTDATWKTSISATASGFERLLHRTDSSWVNARVEGAYGMEPWGAVAKPTATNAVAGGFSGLAIPDPPSAALATPGPASNRKTIR